MNSLPENVETDEAWGAWEKYLESLPKEKLIDFLMMRMSTNKHFMSAVRTYFYEQDEQKDKDSSFS